MNRFRRPSPAMVVAIAALVVACTGSAVAASAVLIKSSRQVKAGVLLGSDLHRNTVDGSRITDGSLGAVDLAAATRKALVGPAGRRGRRGTTGPRGPRGVHGPTGTAVGQVRYVTSSQTLAAGSTGTVSASCPSDLRPVGGGGGGSGAVVVRATGPGGSHKGWTVTATNADANAGHKVKATAVCAPVLAVK